MSTRSSNKPLPQVLMSALYICNTFAHLAVAMISDGRDRRGPLPSGDQEPIGARAIDRLRQGIGYVGIKDYGRHYETLRRALVAGACSVVPGGLCGAVGAIERFATYQVHTPLSVRSIACAVLSRPIMQAEERFVFGEYDTIATVGPSLSINTDARYWNCNNPRHL
jgi:hypothetical protein